MESKSLNYLKADIYRYTKTYSWKRIIKNALYNRTFRPIFTLRMCQYFSEENSLLFGVFLKLFSLLHKYACNKACIDLSWETKIGPGFCITHGWGTVINPYAIIGANVTVFHGVTIGTKHKILESGERIAGYPTIEDNVFIGANSVIIGNIIIGKGSIIAPLTMVFKNVNAHTAIGCNPQEVIKEYTLEDVFNKAPIYS